MATTNVEITEPKHETSVPIDATFPLNTPVVDQITTITFTVTTNPPEVANTAVWYTVGGPVTNVSALCCIDADTGANVNTCGCQPSIVEAVGGAATAWPDLSWTHTDISFSPLTSLDRVIDATQLYNGTLGLTGDLGTATWPYGASVGACSDAANTGHEDWAGGLSKHWEVLRLSGDNPVEAEYTLIQPASSITVQFSPYDYGYRTVAVAVSGSDDVAALTASSTFGVYIRPEVTILSPMDGGIFFPGSTIDLVAVANDSFIETDLMTEQDQGSGCPNTPCFQAPRWFVRNNDGDGSVGSGSDNNNGTFSSIGNPEAANAGLGNADNWTPITYTFGSEAPKEYLLYLQAPTAGGDGVLEAQITLSALDTFGKVPAGHYGVNAADPAKPGWLMDRSKWSSALSAQSMVSIGPAASGGSINNLVNMSWEAGFAPAGRAINEPNSSLSSLRVAILSTGGGFGDPFENYLADQSSPFTSQLHPDTDIGWGFRPLGGMCMDEGTAEVKMSEFRRAQILAFYFSGVSESRGAYYPGKQFDGILQVIVNGSSFDPEGSSCTVTIEGWTSANGNSITQNVNVNNVFEFTKVNTATYPTNDAHALTVHVTDNTTQPIAGGGMGTYSLLAVPWGQWSIAVPGSFIGGQFS